MKNTISINKYKGNVILYGNGKRLIIISSLFAIENGRKQIKKKTKKRKLTILIIYPLLIIFFNSLLGLNKSVFLGAILIDSPDFGFLPTLLFIFFIEKVPKPLISILPPAANESPNKLKIFSSIFSVSLDGKYLNSLPNCSSRSDLFIIWSP